MKKGVGVSILLAILLLPVCAKALIVRDFNDHEAGIIQTGDYYDQVNIWDDANVTMTGGEVLGLYSYDSSTFNLRDGFVNGGLNAKNSSIMNLFGCEQPFTLTANDSSVVNIYGYGFVVDYIGIKGFWANGDQLSIILRPYDETYSHVVLHEIPEPCTFGLFGLGFFFTRRAVKTFHK